MAVKNSFNVLVIEDNPGDFELVKEYLSEHIIPTIVHAETFSAASVILAAGNIIFDVILLDLTLPDKSGKDLITEILSAAMECPVIILTGYSNADFSIQSIYQGVSDYLLKDNLSPISLFKSINYCIQRKKKIRQLKESEKRYSDLFQLSPQPMWLLDAESLGFVQVNKAALILYGYTKSEFLNLTVFDIYHDIKGREFSEVVDHDKEINYKGRFKHSKKSGEIIEVDIYSNPLIIKDKLYRTVIAIDVTEKLLLERKVEEQKILDQKKLMKAVVNAQEKERAEIGEELHDNVNQLLAASKLYLNHSLSQEDKTTFIIKTQEYITNAMDEIRKLSHALVGPTQNSEMGLCDSVEELIMSITNVKDIKIDFKSCPESEGAMEPGLKLVIYRIIQEQLSNILKYAGATEAEILIKTEEEYLIVNINDNGKGFDSSEKKSGIGLRNINNRAGLYNGVVEILSSEGNGCKMKITFKAVISNTAA